MANSTHGAIAPILTVIDGVPTTTSTDVASHFGKRHDAVLRDVRNIIEQLPEDHAHNFVEMVNEVQIGSGATRKDPAYRLTRDGFTLLAMGFTGAKALAFKLAYIKAFNDMEAQLQARAAAGPAVAYISTGELGLDDLHLQQIEGVIKHLRARHDLSAKMLRDAVLSRMGAPSFAHIPRSRFQDAINVLREFAPAPQPQGTQVSVPSPNGEGFITITFTPKEPA